MKLICVSFVMLSLMSIVFLSGCTSDVSNPFNQAYCSSVGNCIVEDKTAEVYDIITIENIEAKPLPDGRVQPGSTVDVYVTLKNNDKNPINQVDILSIAISDTHLFTCIEPDTCEITGRRLVSGGENAYMFTLQAPNNTGSMAEKATIEVSVKYNYTSTRVTTIAYLEKQTYVDYINSGRKATTPISNVPSNGPVDAYIDLSKFGQPVVYDDATMQRKYPIKMIVTNQGQGEISSIGPGNLTLEFEDDRGTFETCAEEFSTALVCNNCPAGTSCVSNTQEIRIRGSKPFSYYFDFTAPAGLTFLNDGMAIAVLKTSANYEYIIRKNYEMTISTNAEI